MNNYLLTKKELNDLRYLIDVINTINFNNLPFEIFKSMSTSPSLFLKCKNTKFNCESIGFEKCENILIKLWVKPNERFDFQHKPTRKILKKTKNIETNEELSLHYERKVYQKIITEKIIQKREAEFIDNKIISYIPFLPCLNQIETFNNISELYEILNISSKKHMILLKLIISVFEYYNTYNNFEGFYHGKKYFENFDYSDKTHYLNLLTLLLNQNDINQKYYLEKAYSSLEFLCEILLNEFSPKTFIYNYNSIEIWELNGIITPYINSISFREFVSINVKENQDIIVEKILEILAGLYTLSSVKTSHNDLHDKNVLYDIENNKVYIFDWGRSYCKSLGDNPNLSKDYCEPYCSYSQCNMFVENIPQDFIKFLSYITKKINSSETEDWFSFAKLFFKCLEKLKIFNKGKIYSELVKNIEYASGPINAFNVEIDYLRECTVLFPNNNTKNTIQSKKLENIVSVFGDIKTLSARAFNDKNLHTKLITDDDLLKYYKGLAIYSLIIYNVYNCIIEIKGGIKSELSNSTKKLLTKKEVFKWFKKYFNVLKNQIKIQSVINMKLNDIKELEKHTLLIRKKCRYQDFIQLQNLILNIKY